MTKSTPGHGAAAGDDAAVGDASLRFEDALERLESLVGALEDGSLDLETSLAHFEEGVRLVRLCQQRLEAAELRIRELDETPQGPRERDASLPERGPGNGE